ncbi:hypothetical protein [Sodalis sp.]|uniref:hypothetical protein n=1 Tax=Sodalis sp. (in: enterobacteria) TaxID=1898979 RepID=UPI003872E600
MCNIKDFLGFASEISTLIGRTNFHCYSRLRDIKIKTNNKENYKKLIQYLTEKKFDFHCYQLKEEKPYRTVLRGLHTSTPISEIKKDLEELGHNVRNISNVLHPTEKYPLPLFFVDLEPAPNNAEIYEINRLVYSCIRFEEPRQRRHIVQCTNCQTLGHTKAYCYHQARCVKCAGSHPSSECQKPRDTPAICALCKEEHPANYKGCVVYKNTQRWKTHNLNLRSKKETAPQDQISGPSSINNPAERAISTIEAQKDPD